MEIVLYAMPESTAGQSLELILRKVSAQATLTRLYTLQRFIQRLISTRGEQQIVIAVVERSKEFIALHSLFDNEDGSNLIIVCDDTPEIIALAHELRPRFLAHPHELIRVSAVVEKIVQSHDHPSSGNRQLPTGR